MNVEQETTLLLKAMLNISDKIDALCDRLDALEASKDKATNDEELLTLKQVQQTLGVGYQKAKELFDNKLPKVQLKKRKMVQRGALREWLQSNADNEDYKALASTYCALNPR